MISEGTKPETSEALIRGFYEVMTGDCGVDPCRGSMAPAEDLCGRARDYLAALSAPPAGQNVKRMREMAAALRNTPAEALREAGYLDRAADMLDGSPSAAIGGRL